MRFHPVIHLYDDNQHYSGNTLFRVCDLVCALKHYQRHKSIANQVRNNRKTYETIVCEGYM